MSLKLVQRPGGSEGDAVPATETIILSEAQVEYLEQISPELNPAHGLELIDPSKRLMFSYAKRP